MPCFLFYRWGAWEWDHWRLSGLPVIMEISVITHLNSHCDFLIRVRAVWGLLKAAGGSKASQQGKSSRTSLGRRKDQTLQLRPTHFDISVIQFFPLQWSSRHTAGSSGRDLREGVEGLKSFSTLCLCPSNPLTVPVEHPNRDSAPGHHHIEP